MGCVYTCRDAMVVESALCTRYGESMTSPALTPQFERALVVAAQWHAPQRKKGSGVPYIAHLLGVASIALEFGADETEAVALLHDAVEDGPGNTGRSPTDLKADIASLFGERALAIVLSCTDAEPEPGKTKDPWANRKKAYLHHLPEADASTLLVSASDKLYNARAILLDFLTEGEQVFSRFTGRREGILWYYRTLADTYQDALRTRPALAQHAKLPQLVEELARTVAALENEARATAPEVRAFDLSAITG